MHADFDDRAFFNADIGTTTTLAATVGGVRTTAALAPGRYLIQMRAASDPAAVTWVHVGKFETGNPIPLAAAAGARKIPLSPEVPAVETNIRIGVSDQVGAITSAGTSTVYITKVSTT